MDSKQILLIILIIQGTLSTVYFSKTKYGYKESVSFCKNVGGKLLQYGQVFLTGIHDCGYTTEIELIWIGHPYYNQIGCTEAIGDKTSVAINNIQFANCSDFCEDDAYTHIGITDTTCTCYLQEPTSERCDKDVRCPGNPFDKCGHEDLYIVFGKEVMRNTAGYKLLLISLSTNGIYNRTCRYRFYGDGFGVSRQPDEESCVYYTGTFFCKVGKGNDINCDIDDIDSNTTTVLGQRSSLVLWMFGFICVIHCYRHR